MYKVTFLKLDFSTSLDQYIRRSDNNSKTEKWTNGTFQADAIFRKTESDWNMAYLARIGNTYIIGPNNILVLTFLIVLQQFSFLEGSPRGLISWKFDLSSTNLAILLVSASCPGTTFEDGEIQWKICSEDQCQILPNGTQFVQYDFFPNLKSAIH